MIGGRRYLIAETGHGAAVSALVRDALGECLEHDSYGHFLQNLYCVPVVTGFVINHADGKECRGYRIVMGFYRQAKDTRMRIEDMPTYSETFYFKECDGFEPVHIVGDRECGGCCRKHAKARRAKNVHPWDHSADETTISVSRRAKSKTETVTFRLGGLVLEGDRLLIEPVMYETNTFDIVLQCLEMLVKDGSFGDGDSLSCRPAILVEGVDHGEDLEEDSYVDACRETFITLGFTRNGSVQDAGPNKPENDKELFAIKECNHYILEHL